MQKYIQIICFSVIVFGLAACGEKPSTVVAPSAKFIHTVAVGQNVYTIAQLHFVSTRDIIAANNLRPPYQIRTGQRLHIPQLRIHTIVQGETLSGIAQRYHVSLFALAQLNRLSPPYKIYQGTRLHIPSSQFAQASTVAKPTTRAKATQPKVQNTPQSQHIALIRAPRRGSLVAKVAPKSQTRKATTLQQQPKSQKTQPAQVVASGRIIWPLQGKVISKFGHKEQGFRNDGINIRAKVGTAVKAVDHGTVVYAGDKLSGFGWILVIRHSNGLMSAYAHNQALLVARGESVKQGQVIARSGMTGSVDDGQLHFELRKAGKPVDPLLYLQG